MSELLESTPWGPWGSLAWMLVLLLLLGALRYAAKAKAGEDERNAARKPRERDGEEPTGRSEQG